MGASLQIPKQLSNDVILLFEVCSVYITIFAATVYDNAAVSVSDHKFIKDTYNT